MSNQHDESYYAAFYFPLYDGLPQKVKDVFKERRATWSSVERVAALHRMGASVHSCVTAANKEADSYEEFLNEVLPMSLNEMKRNDKKRLPTTP